ncbi:MAG: archaeal flagella assembly protein J [Halonotius sp. J07HN4]|nr:MAG: archaeal flagella assembly protein J [Halonotius sp. J07HN4]
MSPTRSSNRRRWSHPLSVIGHLGDRLRQGVDTIALICCHPLVPASRRRKRHTQLAAIHATDPPKLVVARTVLYALLAGLAAWLATLPGAVLLLRSEFWGSMPIVGWLSVETDFSMLTFGLAVGVGLIVAIVVMVATYRLRWLSIAHRATARRRQINRTLPRAVAFMYALARSGMPLPAVLRTLADHEAVYGETAVAIGVTVREIDRFGADVITALEATSDRTPSAELAEFTADLAAVVDSGRPIDDYLRGQHERYREAAADSQQGFLDRLSTAAEGYVTGLVVGPLFVVTTLTIVGLVVTDTLAVLRVFIFGFLPVGTASFLLVIDRLLADRGQARTPPGGDGKPHQWATEPPRSDAQPQVTPSDHSWERQRAILRLTSRFSRYRRLLRRPVATLIERPWLTLPVTVPLGLWWLVAVADLPRSSVTMASATRPLSIVTIAICGAYAIAYEIGAARHRRLTAAVPAFLDRLAGVNEAGLSVVDGIDRVADGDLGALSTPLDRTRRDVRWGADATTALRRLAGRVRSPAVTGAVALVTNALRASNRIGPVAGIAAAELRAVQRLSRRRRRAMVTYLVVIYVAFLSFLGSSLPCRPRSFPRSKPLMWRPVACQPPGFPPPVALGM